MVRKGYKRKGLYILGRKDIVKKKNGKEKESHVDWWWPIKRPRIPFNFSKPIAISPEEPQLKLRVGNKLVGFLVKYLQSSDIFSFIILIVKMLSQKRKFLCQLHYNHIYKPVI